MNRIHLSVRKHYNQLKQYKYMQTCAQKPPQACTLDTSLEPRAFINTNMFVEAFHHNLKDVYLDKKHHRRLDHLLYILLKFTETQLSVDSRKSTKVKPLTE